MASSTLQNMDSELPLELPVSPDEAGLSLEEQQARHLRALEINTLPPADVGQTPKEVLYERGTLKLYHYLPKTDDVYRVPVLIVMATTNKGYLFDLMPGQSMVEFMLDHGFDVYMLDWNEPQPEERSLSLENYTQDFLPHCISMIQEYTGESEISLLGYCQGGVLSLIYAATHADGPLRNLVLFTTPVDFHKMELARIWSDPRFLDINEVADTLGIIPSEMIVQFFEMLRPAQKVAGQMKLWGQSLNDDFVASYRVLDRWGNETLSLPGQYYKDTTQNLSWNNALVKGGLTQRGKAVDLKNIKVPLMHAVAQHDHIVPRGASAPLMDLVGSEDKKEIVLKGGHVSLVAGPRAKGRLWPGLHDWLAKRSV